MNKNTFASLNSQEARTYDSTMAIGVDTLYDNCYLVIWTNRSI